MGKDIFNGEKTKKFVRMRGEKEKEKNIVKVRDKKEREGGKIVQRNDK